VKQHITAEQVSKSKIDWDKVLLEHELFSERNIDIGVTDLEVSSKLTIGTMIKNIEHGWLSKHEL